MSRSGRKSSNSSRLLRFFGEGAGEGVRPTRGKSASWRAAMTSLTAVPISHCEQSRVADLFFPGWWAHLWGTTGSSPTADGSCGSCSLTIPEWRCTAGRSPGFQTFDVDSQNPSGTSVTIGDCRASFGESEGEVGDRLDSCTGGCLLGFSCSVPVDEQRVGEVFGIEGA